MLLALCLNQSNYKCHVMYVSVAGCAPFDLFNYYFLSGKLNLVAKDCKNYPLLSQPSNCQYQGYVRALYNIFVTAPCWWKCLPVDL